MRSISRLIATELGYVEVKLVERSWATSTPREMNRATRAYVGIDHAKLGVEMPEFSQKGDDAALDKAWRSYNRAELARMRELLALAEPYLGELLGGLPPLDWRFSRTAGCSCPCSPGFVNRSGFEPRRDGSRVDLYVSQVPEPASLGDAQLLVAIAAVNAEYGEDEPGVDLEERAAALNAEGERRWGAERMDQLAEHVTASRMTDAEFLAWARKPEARQLMGIA